MRRAAKLETDQPDIELDSTRGVINADLTVGVDVTRTGVLLANDGLCSPGVKLHGSGFIIDQADAERLGLGSADRPGLDAHIRPYRNGRDLTGRSRGKWVIDLFGLGERDVRRFYPEVHDHVSAKVRYDHDQSGVPRVDARGRRTGREWNSRPVYKDNWWVFGEPRSELRPALATLSRYIVTVETSKHRTFQFLDRKILPDNKLIVVASQDAAQLAILSSQLHCEWASATGGWLGVGNDPVYVKSRCFDPFPFPSLAPNLSLELAELAEGLDAHRKSIIAKHSELTVTRLYNALEALRAHDRDPQRVLTPEESAEVERGAVHTLMAWHDDIDQVTLAAYGWSDLCTADGTLDVQAALGRLVALNVERRLEEARGQVRWLRPEYQAPRSRTKAASFDERQSDIEGLLASGGLLAWPSEPRPQLLLIRGALAEAELPQTAAALAARFKGRKAAKEVPVLLTTLERLGQVRAAAGGYTLLRAA